MQLSAPVFVLKQRARALARQQAIALHEALDEIAKREGFRRWSQLAAAVAAERPVAKLYDALPPGHLALIGGRPGHGKTLLGLELAMLAVRRGREGAFFTLEWSPADVTGCLERIGPHPAGTADRLLIDTSDDISAGYVAAQLADAPPGMLIVIDYLQILDQRRRNPPLAEQLSALKAFARAHRSTVVCLSQIDRRFLGDERRCPGLGDVRLPNPADLGAFDRACFIHNGRMELAIVGAGG